MTKYIAKGEVCGDCGHLHRTIRAAVRCVQEHQHSIDISYPSRYPTRSYSDRKVMAVDVRFPRELNAQEETELDRIMEQE